MKTFDSELISGSVTRSVWKLAWPVVLTQLIAGTHGFVDQALVGNYVGPDGNAAIGVAWFVFLVIVVFIASLFQGMAVMVARYAGKQNKEAISRVTYDIFLASTYILLFVAAPVGYFVSPYLITWMNAEPDVQALALPYLRIMFTASTPLFMMFMLNGALQACGDTRTPLKLGILTTGMNVVLSYIFITQFGMGTVGAALGTVLGPLPSIAILLTLIFKRALILPPPERFKWVPDLTVVRHAARIGIPTGIQAVLLNLGGMVIMGFVGTLQPSGAAQAAFSICYSQLFSLVTWVGFGLRAASATLIGQNIGAGKPERGKKGVYMAAALGGMWAVALGILYWFVPGLLLGIFDADEGPVFELGSQFLKYLAFSGLFLISTLAFTGGLQGAGDTKTPMYIAFICQIVILIGYVWTFSALGRLSPAVVWSGILISHMTRFLFSYAIFHRGRWASIEVELRP